MYVYVYYFPETSRAYIKLGGCTSNTIRETLNGHRVPNSRKPLGFSLWKQGGCFATSPSPPMYAQGFGNFGTLCLPCLSVALTRCVSHRVSHFVSHCVSHIVFPTVSATLSPSLCSTLSPTLSSHFVPHFLFHLVSRCVSHLFLSPTVLPTVCWSTIFPNYNQQINLERPPVSRH